MKVRLGRPPGACRCALRLRYSLYFSRDCGELIGDAKLPRCIGAPKADGPPRAESALDVAGEIDTIVELEG